jgi:hypothetical protein
MMNPQPDDEPNEFAALDSFDLLAAFLHAKYGEQALRQVFAQVGCHREQLEQAADILDAKGLSHVANIVADIAAECPSEIESCPYDPGTVNARYWRENWLRKHQETPAERLERMKRQAAGKKQRMH